MEYSTHYYWQIIAWDEHGYSAVGPVWDFTTGSDPNNPPDPPSSPDPLDGATDIDIDADLSWDCSDPDGDSLTYDVYLDIVNPPEDRVSDDQVETVFDPGTLEFDTTYYWQVIAKDENGATTAGVIWQFSTRINNPPDTPTIDGPNGGKPGIDYEYCIIASDPDNDTLFVLWNWGDGTGSDWLGPLESGMDVCDSHSWNETGTYEISVTVRDEYGESVTAYKEVTIPRNKVASNNLFQWFLERFPFLGKIFLFLII